MTYKPNGKVHKIEHLDMRDMSLQFYPIMMRLW